MKTDDNSAGAIADEDAAAEGCGLQGEDLIEKDLCFGGGGGEGCLGVGGGSEEIMRDLAARQFGF